MATTKKPTVKKSATVKTAAVKNVETKKETSKGMMSVYTMQGEKVSEIAVPSVFTGTVNMQLVAQAVRVYQANQREGSASTKTRGLVEGSTRKLYKQKGTGRARHGSIRANVFVGGGIVFGPQPRDYSLKLTQTMKNEALKSVVTLKAKDQDIVVLDDENMTKPQTKLIAAGLKKIGTVRSMLILVDDMHTNFVKSARNIDQVCVKPVHTVTTYEFLMSHTVICTKKALKQLEERFK